MNHVTKTLLLVKEKAGQLDCVTLNMLMPLRFLLFHSFWSIKLLYRCRHNSISRQASHRVKINCMNKKGEKTLNNYQFKGEESVTSVHVVQCCLRSCASVLMFQYLVTSSFIKLTKHTSVFYMFQLCQKTSASPNTDLPSAYQLPECFTFQWS